MNTPALRPLRFHHGDLLELIRVAVHPTPTEVFP